MLRRSAVSLLPAAARSPAACRAFSSVTIDVDGDYDSSSSSEGGSDVYPSAEADGNAYSLQSSVVAIDAQAPSFSCNAVVDGEIKWYVLLAPLWPAGLLCGALYVGRYDSAHACMTRP